MTRRWAIGCLLVAAAACEGKGPTPAPQVGSPAPEYSAKSLAGDSVSLAGLRGKVVLLNVWATWCAPCREEIPALQRLHQAHAARGLEVVGVSVDAPGEEESIRDFVKEFGVTYPIWYDEENTVTPTFRLIGVPSTFLIDREGKIAWKFLGPVESNDSTLARALREVLAGTS